MRKEEFLDQLIRCLDDGCRLVPSKDVEGGYDVQRARCTPDRQMTWETAATWTLVDGQPECRVPNWPWPLRDGFLEDLRADRWLELAVDDGVNVERVQKLTELVFWRTAPIYGIGLDIRPGGVWITRKGERRRVTFHETASGGLLLLLEGASGWSVHEMPQSASELVAALEE